MELTNQRYREAMKANFDLTDDEITRLIEISETPTELHPPMLINFVLVVHGRLPSKNPVGIALLAAIAYVRSNGVMPDDPIALVESLRLAR